MSLPIKLLSTDFDGTCHSDWDNPPIPKTLETLIARLQDQNVSWVINTGRDLPSLLDSLNKASVAIRPNYVVVVEREIYELQGTEYTSVLDWNQKCSQVHAELFSQVRPHLPEAFSWINQKYKATIYEDTYSPFCLIAECVKDAEDIHEYLSVLSEKFSDLALVRNDVYARFSHKAYNKGTALAEIARRLQIKPEQIMAAGDHLNDLPMLSSEFAHWLVAPVNAINQVKEVVLRHNGYVSDKHCGAGVAQGIEQILSRLGVNLSGSHS
ncbi:MAG: HAD family hydrolase [Verrucomicrobiales bacterium]